MRDGHLLKRASTEFVRNLLWMAVVFGSLAAILAAVTDLSLVEVMAFVGVCVAVMAAIVTVGGSGAGPTTSRASVATPTLAHLPKPAAVIGPVAVGGMVAEEETAAVGGVNATFTPIHLHGHGDCGGRSC
jgi:hypothetical protein